jgi:multiple sugar transport system substrate-binding protein
LNQFDPAALNALRALDSQGKLLGLPYAMNFSVLYYNKDIFDKFGVSYPKDGMSWNQTVELARKVTRSDAGVNYVGLDPTGITRVGSGLSLPYVDPKTNKPLIDKDGWKKILNMLQGLYDTPGFVNGSKFSYGSDAFTKDKTLAMLAEWGNKMSGLMEQVYISGDKMNWDMATIPNFDGSVGTGRETDLHALLVSKVSKHKDQAFQVTALVGSDEVQQITNSYGRLTAFKKTDAYKKSFGTKLTSMKGKHIDAIFNVTPGPTHVPTIYDKSVTAALNNADKAVALKQKDVNTALRDAQAEADKAIQAQLGGGAK